MNLVLTVYELKYDDQGSWYYPIEIELTEKNLGLLKNALEKLDSTNKSDLQEEGEKAYSTQDR